jgi:transcriptional/translational regulatory protein YebC/TACO1
MWKSAGRAPSLRVLPWHFALQLRKKHGKNLSQVKKNLSQHTVYILPKHTHKVQDNIKPPQYKLKQIQYKIYPNETVTI